MLFPLSCTRVLDDRLSDPTSRLRLWKPDRSRHPSNVLDGRPPPLPDGFARDPMGFNRHACPACILSNCLQVRFASSRSHIRRTVGLTNNSHVVVLSLSQRSRHAAVGPLIMLPASLSRVLTGRLRGLTNHHPLDVANQEANRTICDDRYRSTDSGLRSFRL